MSRLAYILSTAILIAACGGAITGAESGSLTTTSTTGVSTSTTTTEAGSEGTATTAAPPTTVPATTTSAATTVTTTTDSSAVPDSIMAALLLDASKRADVPLDQLTLVKAEAVEWSDASLGCPEPGMAYAQVITPGYWVQISGGGTLYDYRVASSGDFRLCAGTSGEGLVIPDPPVKVDPILAPPQPGL